MMQRNDYETQAVCGRGDLYAVQSAQIGGQRSVAPVPTETPISTHIRQMRAMADTASEQKFRLERILVRLRGDMTDGTVKTASGLCGPASPLDGPILGVLGECSDTMSSRLDGISRALNELESLI